MSEKTPPNPPETPRRPLTPAQATSPRAVETTLGRISDEVMDEAIARRERERAAAASPARS